MQTLFRAEVADNVSKENFRECQYLKFIDNKWYVIGSLYKNTIIPLEMFIVIGIKPKTVSINIEGVLDGDSEKIFASLSEDSIGGDILIGFDNKTEYKVYQDKHRGVFMSRGVNRPETVLDTRLKVIGVQK